MTFEEFGSTLRDEREKRGLSIDDAAGHLKIGARILRAMEEGDMASLPHLAYVRGFVRAYAGYLGMSEDEIEAGVECLAPARQAVPQPPREEIAIRPAHAAGKGKFLAAVAAVLIAVGLYAAWHKGLLKLPVSPQETAAPAPDAPDGEVKPQQKTYPVPVSSMNNAPMPAAPRQAGGTKKETPVPQPAAGSGAKPDASPAGNAVAAQGGREGVKEDAADANKGLHKVVIVATEECWVHSNADSTDTRQFSLRRGDTFALTFKDKLELRLGNAGGVQLRYDGRDLPAPGRSGQVKSVVFPPAAQ
ncbi:MAG: helix-turn-helix domain-containing protein [Desulfovibrio sp.]|nr:helix-turn-helix domain-containing protein [Desulfovibrio sp.]